MGWSYRLSDWLGVRVMSCKRISTLGTGRMKTVVVLSSRLPWVGGQRPCAKQKRKYIHYIMCRYDVYLNSIGIFQAERAHLFPNNSSEYHTHKQYPPSPHPQAYPWVMGHITAGTLM